MRLIFPNHFTKNGDGMGEPVDITDEAEAITEGVLALADKTECDSEIFFGTLLWIVMSSGNDGDLDWSNIISVYAALQSASSEPMTVH